MYSGVCVLALLIGYWFYQGSSIPDSSSGSDKDTVVSVSQQSVSDLQVQNAESPFSVKDADSEAAEVTSALEPSPRDGLPQSSVNAVVPSDTPVQPIDVSSLGRTALSDEQFLELAERFRNDPASLQLLIDEFRQETDPTRQAALSRLLGEIGGPDITLTASELVFSGDPESRRIGLELLQAIQPGNAEARDIASTMLATEVEPGVLVDTLTTLARPGTVDDGTRQYLSDQIAFLAEHDSEKVRSVSLNILSRWSKDGQYTEVIRGGLTDQAPVVRESAAYALVGHNNVTQTLVDSLLSVATDEQEEEQARRGAVLALKGMPISDIERQRVLDAELEMDTIRR